MNRLIGNGRDDLTTHLRESCCMHLPLPESNILRVRRPLVSGGLYAEGLVVPESVILAGRERKPGRPAV